MSPADTADGLAATQTTREVPTSVTSTDITPQAPSGLAVRIDGGCALTAASVAQLSAFCDRVEDREHGAAAVIRVTGTPDASWTNGLDVQLVNKWERTLRRLERLDAATVAVATGDCGGPALEALLATDYRIATDSLRLVVPAQSGAAWPGMAVYRLANQAGVARTRRAVLFGTPIGAGEALEINLVDEIVADEATALARAAEIAERHAGPELAIRRQLMLDATTTSFEDALGSHLAACDRALRLAATGAAS